MPLILKSNRPIWQFYLYFPFGNLLFIRKNKVMPRLTVKTDLVPSKSKDLDSRIWWSPRK